MFDDRLYHVVVSEESPFQDGDSVRISIQFLDGPLEGLTVEADAKKKYLPGDDGE